MFIVSKTRKAVVNVSNAVGLSVRNKKVIAVFENTGEVFLGEYETEERAQEVFADMLAKCFCPSVINLQDVALSDEDRKTLRDSINRPVFVECKEPARINQIDLGVYYMPEE